MAQEWDPAEIARAIIDANLYMTIGTGDAAGTPWVSPVYYAPVGYGEFLWISSPDSKHSRNIEARPSVAIVIFDSTAPISTGQGVYMSATARELPADEVDEAIEVFSRRAVSHGGQPFSTGDVRAPSAFRIYSAIVSGHFVLEADHDRRVAVTP
jgi:nitroimidazol reductase NimA-like FMN-containing flavoprotein (pyridoxamine 5'-phosphate oxidase superfamily)